MFHSHARIEVCLVIHLSSFLVLSFCFIYVVVCTKSQYAIDKFAARGFPAFAASTSRECKHFMMQECKKKKKACYAFQVIVASPEQQTINITTVSIAVAFPFLIHTHKIFLGFRTNRLAGGVMVSNSFNHYTCREEVKRKEVSQR